MEGKDLYDLICMRRSCRAYLAKQVAPDLLLQVIEAGRMAPSGMNVQQCHFIAIRKQELLEKIRALMEQIVANLDATTANPMLAQSIKLAKVGKHNFYYGAPTLIVVANRRDNANNVPDSAAALQNMMLMATAVGLGNCWINNLRWNGDAPPIRQFLEEIGVKQDEAVYGALALGYAVDAPKTALVRSGNVVDIWE
ncbi:MAG: nitroreductase family protein [Firmicutes bacterium]|nr:nitroreductase family protein [Bacillota bacterium]